jgi:hypothetical protein
MENKNDMRKSQAYDTHYGNRKNLSGFEGYNAYRVNPYDP